jgi:quercetin dioxygenase-like cupin family protein
MFYSFNKNGVVINLKNETFTMKSTEIKAFINSGNIKWETVDNGVERKILGYDDQVMMVCVRFEQGAIGSLHHHLHRQVSYVESGRFEVTIDGKKSILEQGDCFFVAPDLVHGVVALEKGTLVDVFTPARMDFI